MREYYIGTNSCIVARYVEVQVCNFWGSEFFCTNIKESSWMPISCFLMLVFGMIFRAVFEPAANKTPRAGIICAEPSRFDTWSKVPVTRSPEFGAWYVLYSQCWTQGLWVLVILAIDLSCPGRGNKNLAHNYRLASKPSSINLASKIQASRWWCLFSSGSRLNINLNLWDLSPDKK